MLLPEIDILVKWTGHRSLGALLLDSQTYDREANAKEHKILSELRAGKPVSNRRIIAFSDRMLMKWVSDAEDRALKSAHFRNLLMKDCPSGLQLEEKNDLTILFWEYLKECLPERHKKTQQYIDGLQKKSIMCWRLQRENNHQAIASKLRDPVYHQGFGGMSRFLSDLADEIEAGNHDAAYLEVSTFNMLLIMTTYLYESSGEAPMDQIRKLFAVDREQVAPLMSFARWLERIEAITGHRKDTLLLNGFVNQNRASTSAEDRDVRNALRNPRRYRTGELVPSYQRTVAFLRGISPQGDKYNQQQWTDELEQREVGALFTILVSNAARSIEAIGGRAERPFQAIFHLWKMSG